MTYYDDVAAQRWHDAQGPREIDVQAESILVQVQRIREVVATELEELSTLLDIAESAGMLPDHDSMVEDGELLAAIDERIRALVRAL